MMYNNKSKMTPKNWTLGVMGGQKSSKIVKCHLWTFPRLDFFCEIESRTVDVRKSKIWHSDSL